MAIRAHLSPQPAIVVVGVPMGEATSRPTRALALLPLMGMVAGVAVGAQVEARVQKRSTMP
jgi:hypothetical protein